MSAHNPKNDRIKHRYFSYLKEARRYSEQTIDASAKAISRFENDTKFCDFSRFHIEQAIAFKRHLADQDSSRPGLKLSKSTVDGTLTHLRRFFLWLADQPGFKSRIRYTDADYFNISEKDARIARARREMVVPTLEQVRHVIGSMPAGTAIEKRDRAVMAFALLTGARDGAIASIKLKHVNLNTHSVHQDAREVRTKFSKTFTTTFFPVGEDIEQILIDWVTHLRQDLLWGNDDPLFPKCRMEIDANGQFHVAGLAREHWSTATAIRDIFKAACAGAGVPYFNPHSIRNTLVQLGQQRCRNPEEMKAWSQNLGHEQVLTTLLSYGQVADHRQRELIRGLAEQSGTPMTDVDAIADAVARKLRLGESQNW
ncbi:MAG: site-specific integrase [Gammaproteobacteria bacterium]